MTTDNTPMTPCAVYTFQGMRLVPESLLESERTRADAAVEAAGFWERRYKAVDRAAIGAAARIADLEAKVQRLTNDLHHINEMGETPDGDGVNVNVQLWAETWIERLREALKAQESGQ